jgi:hypothetical protein
VAKPAIVTAECKKTKYLGVLHKFSVSSTAPIATDALVLVLSD